MKINSTKVKTGKDVTRIDQFYEYLQLKVKGIEEPVLVHPSEFLKLITKNTRIFIEKKKVRVYGEFEDDNLQKDILQEPEMIKFLKSQSCCGKKMKFFDIGLRDPYNEIGGMALCMECGNMINLSGGQLDEEEVDNYRNNY